MLFIIIMLPQFYNRARELQFLEKRYASGKPELLIIYGRRRTGKTSLIREFLNRKKGIYHLCTKDSIAENIKSLAFKIAKFTGKDHLKALDSWDAIFSAISEIKAKKIPIILDEFPYLIELDRAIPSQFQHLWDERLYKDERILLLLCGSSISIMETEVLGVKSPLYGRRTGSWKVTPFTPSDLRKIFPAMDLQTFIGMWSVFGSLPNYFLPYDKRKSLEQNIKELILNKGSFLYEEPKMLLREEFREPRNIYLILKSIASGLCTPGKIQNSAGIDRGNISKYLEMLLETNILGYERLYHKKRGGIYFIDDNLFNFWFKFVYPHLSELEMGKSEAVFNDIDLNVYISGRFERLVQELLMMKGYQTSRYIFKDLEIDALAFDEKNKRCIIGEVKWENKPIGFDILNSLKEKAQQVPVPKGYSKHLLLVSRSGFKDVEKMKNEAELWDLEMIERMLA
jgi:AAA+ ATPase superfamily predicted ATPase